jgi:hypothetical protein
MAPDQRAEPRGSGRPRRRGPSRHVRRRLTWALIVSLLLAGAGGWLWWSRPSQPGEPAPDFALPASTGEIVRLEDYRGKQPIVLVFYMVGT